jgi:adenosylcobalamin-dependent ribonucleoside-triphosphate reductase
MDNRKERFVLQFSKDEESLNYLNGYFAGRMDPLGQVVHAIHYSRLKPNGEKETLADTCIRVVEGTFTILKRHCLYHDRPWDEDKAQRTAMRMLEAMLRFKFLPPGRGLWAMGTEHVEKHGGTALNNCGFVSTKNLAQDPVAPFTWMMNAMMLGTGVGFDTLGEGTVRVRQSSADMSYLYRIQDSREGWVIALATLLGHYLKPHLPKPIFDYSRIRPKGSPLKTFGGVAAGPEPLKTLLEGLDRFLSERRGQYLTSTDILDMMNMVGLCVVSGNIRRGAQIALGDPTDQGFIRAKQVGTPGVDEAMAWRRMSNNSVMVRVEDFADGRLADTIGQLASLNGEPGVFWLDMAQQYGRLKDGVNFKDYRAAGTNPCGEQTLESFELCCLVETFMANHESLADYLSTLKVAYLYAKAVTLAKTGDEKTDEIIARNRRIGCSQSGIINAFEKFGRSTVLRWSDAAYTFLEGLDIQYSDWLGVARSIKRTSVKPSGTVSLLAGETPGIHYPHATFYVRRMRLAANHPMVERLAEAGYHIEPCVYEPSTTVVVSFPMASRYKDMPCKDDVTIWEQVQNAVDFQHYWADNQVSITVTVKPSEFQEIPRVLSAYNGRLKAISFLPSDEKMVYQQPVLEKISEEHYAHLISGIRPIRPLDGAEAEGSWYCESDSCSTVR